MKDYVVANENEKEFISMAETLGIKEIMFLYSLGKFESIDVDQFQNITKIKIHKGILVSMVKDIFVAVKKGFTVVEAGPELRGILEAGPHLVFGCEELSKKDFIHHRGSGFNHVLAKIARDKQVSIGFSFASIVRSDGPLRSQIIGRMSQNKDLFKKYKVIHFVASFAKSPEEMRAIEEMRAFERIV